MFICGSLHNLFSSDPQKKTYRKLKLIAITKKKKDNINFRDVANNLAVDQFDVYNFKEAIFNII